MQKTGKLFQELLPRIIVPLDSAVIFTLYTMYSTALRHFLQYVFRWKTIIKTKSNYLRFSVQKIVIPAAGFRKIHLTFVGRHRQDYAVPRSE